MPASFEESPRLGSDGEAMTTAGRDMATGPLTDIPTCGRMAMSVGSP